MFLQIYYALNVSCRTPLETARMSVPDQWVTIPAPYGGELAKEEVGTVYAAGI